MDARHACKWLKPFLAAKHRSLKQDVRPRVLDVDLCLGIYKGVGMTFTDKME